MAELKVITIDFWNTLFDSTDGKERNQLRVKILIEETDKLGRWVKPDELNEGMTASWKYFNNIWKTQQRTPSPEEMVHYYLDRLGLPLDKNLTDTIINRFAQTILDRPPKIIPGVKDSLERISKDFKLAIISDTGFTPGSVLKEFMSRHEILHYFSAFSFSDETHVAKPQAKAFQTVLDQLGIEPENALHIGDIEFTDVAGAKSIGMKAIRFTGDTSAFLNLDNPEITKAEADCKTWQEIVDTIYKLKV